MAALQDYEVEVRVRLRVDNEKRDSDAAISAVNVVRDALRERVRGLEVDVLEVREVDPVLELKWKSDAE